MVYFGTRWRLFEQELIQREVNIKGTEIYL